MIRNLDELKNRFMSEPFEKKLGHLASDLARIASFAEDAGSVQAAMDVIEESKFFIEWMAPDAAADLRATLSDIQIRLAYWQVGLAAFSATPAKIDMLRRTVKRWSRELLNASGLLTRS